MLLTSTPNKWFTIVRYFFFLTYLIRNARDNETDRTITCSNDVISKKLQDTYFVRNHQYTLQTVNNADAD